MNSTFNATADAVMSVNVSGEIITTLRSVLVKIPLLQESLSQSPFKPTPSPFQLQPQQVQPSTPFSFVPQQQPPLSRQQPLVGFGSTNTFEFDQPKTMQQQSFFQTAKKTLQRDQENRWFIPANPKLFHYLLDFLRTDLNPDFLPTGTRKLKQLLKEVQMLDFVETSDVVNVITQEIQRTGSELSLQNPPSLLRNETASTSGQTLLKMNVLNSSEPLVVHEDAVVPGSEIQFTLFGPAPVLLEWSIKDSAGEFGVEIDEQRLDVLPAISGITFDGELKIDYTLSTNVRYVHQFSSGDHKVRLLWRVYRRTSYTLEGPVIAAAYQLDASKCTISTSAAELMILQKLPTSSMRFAF